VSLKSKEEREIFNQSYPEVKITELGQWCRFEMCVEILIPFWEIASDNIGTQCIFEIGIVS
jgi:hypothetical protein